MASVHVFYSPICSAEIDTPKGNRHRSQFNQQVNNRVASIGICWSVMVTDPEEFGLLTMLLQYEMLICILALNVSFHS
jgi:hypothetical protein